MFIDTHCHLNFKTFAKNIDKVINTAKKAGVKKFVVPGTNLDSSQKAVELAQKHNNVYASVGIHPHHANESLKVAEFKSLKKNLEKLAQNKKVVGIGECGLDYYQYQKTKYKDYKIDKNFKRVQKKIFELQIKLAYDLNLPLIIHNREASDDVLEIINQQSAISNQQLKGIFHCFMGNNKLLTWALEHNFYIGINGLVTYNQTVQTIAKQVPLEKILIETDAPLLTPEPLRSQKSFPNKPENVKIVAKWIAKIKSDSFLRIAEQTTKNALQLFKLD